MQVRFLPEAQTKQSPFTGVLFCLLRTEKPNCFGFVRNRKSEAYPRNSVVLFLGSRDRKVNCYEQSELQIPRRFLPRAQKEMTPLVFSFCVTGVTKLLQSRQESKGVALSKRLFDCVVLKASPGRMFSQSVSDVRNMAPILHPYK